MNELPEHWRRRLARKASLLVPRIGQPVDDKPMDSWFGRVTLRETGEDWPTCGGRLMWPLLQIAVRELPFCPAALDDLALIRVFVDPAFTAPTENGGIDFYHPEGVDGKGWLVSACGSLSRLVCAEEPDHGSPIRPFAGSWQLIEADYPTYDDLPPDFPEPFNSDYDELGLNTNFGTKVGGWPYNVQSEICWGPNKQHPYKPEYVFQIDSDYERGWMWGDSGIGYFGRGTGAHRGKWAMEWQCC